MLLATGIPTIDDRTAAVGAIPCASDLNRSAGIARSILDNQAVDLIDASLGVDNHARAALVALHEGFDYLFQSLSDVVESVAADSYFTRTHPFDPLGVGPRPPLLSSPSKERFHFRLAYCGVENAAVKVATAGDHFANTHLRLAWEANAATRSELVHCGFDPDEPEPKTWASLERLRKGLRQARRQPLSVFPSFGLNAPFQILFSNRELRKARRFRDEVVHRERPSYREAASFGRASLWRSGEVRIKYSPPPDRFEGLPSIAKRRAMLASAMEATLGYGDACMDLAIRWLGTIDVPITVGDGTTNIQVPLRGPTGHRRANSAIPGSFFLRVGRTNGGRLRRRTGGSGRPEPNADAAR